MTNANYERILCLHFVESLIHECINTCKLLETQKDAEYDMQNTIFKNKYCTLIETLNKFFLYLDSENLDFSRQNLTTYVDIIYNFRKVITSYDILKDLINDKRIILTDYLYSSKKVIKSFIGIDDGVDNYTFINYTEFTETFQLLKPPNISTYTVLCKTSNSFYIEKECFWDDGIPYYLVHNLLYISRNDVCGEIVTHHCFANIPTYRQAFLLFLEK